MLRTLPESLHQGGLERAVYTVNTLLIDLKSCSMKRDLLWGRRIHANAMECKNESNMYVVTALIKMYAKCGNMLDAHRLFDSMQNPDAVSWSSLLLGYAEKGEGMATLDLFSRMKTRGHAPNSVAYIAAIKACTSLALNGEKAICVERGRDIHLEIGWHSEQSTLGTLIEMYAKCGCMGEARRVFDNLKNPDVVSWTALLLGYAENGEGHIALDLFMRMKTHGCAPNSLTYVAALKACASLAANGGASRKMDFLEQGRKIHSEVGCHLNLYVLNALIDMYNNCGSVVDARRVFDSIRDPDVVSWNALLQGYVENGESVAALELFSKMKARGCAPTSTTYVASIKACTTLAFSSNDSRKADVLKQGKEIHSEIGCHMNHYVQSALVDMYSKCGIMHEARRVFDSIQQPDVVAWTALVMGYAENGDGLVSLELFSRMKACGCAPNPITYVAALRACSLTGALVLGREFHSDIREFTAPVVTALVSFYAKCGSMEEAREVFDFHSRTRDVSTWNALLAGYARFGNAGSVFLLFEAMQDTGFRPDAVTFLWMLFCCSHTGLVEKAVKYFESMPLQYGVTPTVMHYTCMVDILGRANQLNNAISVIKKMPCNPNVATWVSLLSSCRKWKNVEIGRWAFQSLVDMEENNGAAYVLMAHIYGSKGMWEEQESVLAAGMRLSWA